jgi:hypothetical protein
MFVFPSAHDRDRDRAPDFRRHLFAEEIAHHVVDVVSRDFRHTERKSSESLDDECGFTYLR